MKCPNCNKEISIPNAALSNADTYGKPVLSISECCGIAFHVRPIRKFEFSVYEGSKTHDDWGRDIKQLDYPITPEQHFPSIEKRNAFVNDLYPDGTWLFDKKSKEAFRVEKLDYHVIAHYPSRFRKAVPSEIKNCKPVISKTTEKMKTRALSKKDFRLGYHELSGEMDCLHTQKQLQLIKNSKHYDFFVGLVNELTFIDNYTEGWGGVHYESELVIKKIIDELIAVEIYRSQYGWRRQFDCFIVDCAMSVFEYLIEKGMVKIEGYEIGVPLNFYIGERVMTKLSVKKGYANKIGVIAQASEGLFLVEIEGMEPIKVKYDQVLFNVKPVISNN